MITAKDHAVHAARVPDRSRTVLTDPSGTLA
jgi:hypothetical protein